MKNIRLRFKDLYNGRVVYLSEPGRPVVIGTIGKKYRAMVTATGFHCSEKELSEKEIYSSLGSYKNIFRGEDIQKHFPQFQNLENMKTLVEMNLSFSSENVEIFIGGKVHYFQDLYFSPTEAKLKVFAKKTQAKRYALYPSDFGKDLETIFSVK